MSQTIAVTLHEWLAPSLQASLFDTLALSRITSDNHNPSGPMYLPWWSDQAHNLVRNRIGSSGFNWTSVDGNVPNLSNHSITLPWSLTIWYFCEFQNNFPTPCSSVLFVLLFLVADLIEDEKNKLYHILLVSVEERWTMCHHHLCSSLPWPLLSWWNEDYEDYTSRGYPHYTHEWEREG